MALNKFKISPFTILKIAITLTILSFSWLSYSIYNIYQFLQQTTSYDILIADLSGKVMQYDEILTMSAMMGAVTGDKKWEQRYIQYENKLDRVIKDLAALTKELDYKQSIAQTDIANQKLVSMEQQAFEFVNQNKLSQAQDILFSEKYKQQKTIYLDGQVQTTNYLQTTTQNRLQAGRNKTISIVIILITIAMILSIVWIIALKSINKWHKSLKQASKKTYTAKTQLEKSLTHLSNANAKLERFNYIAAHDLKEPLRKIHSFTQLLAEQLTTNNTPIIHTYLSKIQKSNLHMTQLINSILEYSNISHTQDNLEEININEIIHYLTNEVLDIAIKEANAEISYTSFPKIRTNRTQISQIFQNLISNALKYRSQYPPKINIAYQKDDNNHIFTIEDNGIGIDKKHHKEIFNMFTKLHHKHQYQSIGLGLAICKKSLENQGGKIWVTSEENKGSKFYFAIPV